MAQPRSRSRSIRRRFVPFLLLALAGALQAPFATAEGDRLLVFTKTAGYRHDSIPAAVAAISGLAARYRIAVEHSEDASLFRLDNLLRFKAVAFVNTTGDILDEEQQRAFEAFIGAGGGYLGVHSAADTEYDWPWYGELVGAWFKKSSARLADGHGALRASARRQLAGRMAGDGRVLQLSQPPERRGYGDLSLGREHL